MPRYDQQRTGSIQEVEKGLMEIGSFICSICGESSRDICVFCTKDACGNHLCERCHRCSDCCECDVRLRDHESQEHVESHLRDMQVRANGSGPIEVPSSFLASPITDSSSE